MRSRCIRIPGAEDIYHLIPDQYRSLTIIYRHNKPDNFNFVRSPSESNSDDRKPRKFRIPRPYIAYPSFINVNSKGKFWSTIMYEIGFLKKIFIRHVH